MLARHYRAARYFEPWAVLNQLQRRLNQYFDGDPTVNNNARSSATADWIPAADIDQYTDRFVLKLDIPGVDPNAVDITLEQGILAVVGIREKDQAESDLQRERSERPMGRFHRRFAFPETADANGVKAAGENGVLHITIPKDPKAQPKRIKVALDIRSLNNSFAVERCFTEKGVARGLAPAVHRHSSTARVYVGPWLH